jgi:hypothetical protein
MNRQASAALVNQCRWQCLRVLTNGPTPEQLVAAEMYLASLAPSPQASLFNATPPTRESCPAVVPSLQAGRRGSSVGQ